MKNRIRRTPEDARRLILDAAEKVMAAEGPAGLRLADVARTAGVSHPTVLHHFGNREGLIVALNRRSLEVLRVNLLAMMAGEAASNESAVTQTFAAYRAGLAQRILWLLQQSAMPSPRNMPIFEEMVARFHELRLQFAAPGADTDPYDSRAIVHLMTLVGFADAVIGPRIRNAASAKDEKAQRERFEAWFSKFLDDYIERKAGK